MVGGGNIVGPIVALEGRGCFDSCGRRRDPEARPYSMRFLVVVVALGRTAHVEDDVAGVSLT
jgi:hypothetical protein